MKKVVGVIISITVCMAVQAKYLLGGFPPPDQQVVQSNMQKSPLNTNQ